MASLQKKTRQKKVRPMEEVSQENIGELEKMFFSLNK